MPTPTPPARATLTATIPTISSANSFDSITNSTVFSAPSKLLVPATVIFAIYSPGFVGFVLVKLLSPFFA